MWSEQNRERLVQQIDYEVLVNLQFFFSKKMDCQPLFLLDLDDLGLEDSLKLAFVGLVARYFSGNFYRIILNKTHQTETPNLDVSW